MLSLLLDAILLCQNLLALRFVAHSFACHFGELRGLEPPSRKLPFLLQLFLKLTVLSSGDQETFCDLMHV